jgi:DNA repair protein SbcD/Mre11
VIKFIHFSDSHIGVDTIGPLDPETRISSRVLDYLDSMDAIIDFAVEEDVDIALFTGDAFHVGNPNPIYLVEFSKRIIRLMKQCPTILLVGNHDQYRQGSFLDVYSVLSSALENVAIGNVYETWAITTKHGDIQITTAPWPTKDMQGSIDDAIYKLGVHINNKSPSILMGHFSVEGAQYGAERDYVMGKDAIVHLDTLVTGPWDYVALGHIHMYQVVFDDPPVVYAGSIERVTFNEEKEAKGFVYGTIDGHDVKYEFVQLDVRPYKTVDVKVNEQHPTDKVLHAIYKRKLKQAVVRVNIHIPEGCTRMVDVQAIYNALSDADVYTVTGVNVIPIHSDNKRNDSDVIVDSSMAYDQALKRYLEAKRIKPNTLKTLMRMAVDIMMEEE